ncbi:MAG TPA: STY0301 family protein [Bryobacteraceae bacterium]|nr:STY0301 family protein [Bryobacteraceae bacterium]
MLRFVLTCLVAALAATAADLCPVARLSMVAFFDGKPEDQASLVYDEIVTTKDGSRATWHLTPDSERGYYLVCTYEKPAKPVTQRLSPKLTTCVVEYGKPAEASKLPPVRSIQCK